MTEEDFPAELFPASFTLIYCPWEACEEERPFKDPMKLVEHLAVVHNKVIERPKEILPFLDRYLSEHVQPAQNPVMSEEEDTALRHRLQHVRLEEVLRQQERERAESHRRGRHCLFCVAHHCASLPTLFSHMFREHSFNIGQLDNLVFIDEFLDLLQAKLANHVCIYCDRQFPNMPTLKKHLKNKNHYRIHPKNHLYDRFYIVNYLQVGKLYVEADEEREVPEGIMVAEHEERGGALESAAGEEWGELDEVVDEITTCLLCSHTENNAESIVEHMIAVHNFDWDHLTSHAHLDIYASIKIINYIRSRIAQYGCIYCDVMVDEEDVLLRHLSEHDPLGLPQEILWQDSRYLFPVYDEDPMLCYNPGQLS